MPSRETPEVYTQHDRPPIDLSHTTFLPFSHLLLATPLLSKHCVLLFISPLRTNWEQSKRLLIVCFSREIYFVAVLVVDSWSDTMILNNIFPCISSDFVPPFDVSLTWSTTWKIHLFTIVRLWIIFKIIKQQNRDHFGWKERINTREKENWIITCLFNYISVFIPARIFFSSCYSTNFYNQYLMFI